jgi:hypothetical protein
MVAHGERPNSDRIKAPNGFASVEVVRRWRPANVAGTAGVGLERKTAQIADILV